MTLRAHPHERADLGGRARKQHEFGPRTLERVAVAFVNTQPGGSVDESVAADDLAECGLVAFRESHLSARP